MPILCLLAPVLAHAGASLAPRLAAGGALAALVVLFPSVRHNSRPLRTMFFTSPDRIMFWHRPNLLEPTRQAAAFACGSGLEVIGFDLLPDDFEYPLQKLMIECSDRRPRFVRLNGYLPGRPSAVAEPPELLIAYDSAAPVGEEAAGRDRVRAGRPVRAVLGVRAEGAARTRQYRPRLDRIRGLGAGDGVRSDRHVALGMGVGGCPVGALSQDGAEFTSPGGPAALSILLRQADRTGQSIAFVLNGTRIGELDLGAEGGFVSHRLEFGALRGVNRLALDYARQPSAGSQAAVEYRKVRITAER